MATNMRSGSKYDIEIVQGATLNLKFSYKDSSQVAINLSGYTARMQIRASHDAASFLVELTTENGGIVLNSPAVGDIIIKISASASAAYTFTTGVYDIELLHTDGEVIVDNILYGDVSVRRNVTK